MFHNKDNVICCTCGTTNKFQNIFFMYFLSRSRIYLLYIIFTILFSNTIYYYHIWNIINLYIIFSNQYENVHFIHRILLPSEMVMTGRFVYTVRQIYICMHLTRQVATLHSLDMYLQNYYNIIVSHIYDTVALAYL